MDDTSWWRGDLKSVGPFDRSASSKTFSLRAGARRTSDRTVQLWNTLSITYPPWIETWMMLETDAAGGTRGEGELNHGAQAKGRSTSLRTYLQERSTRV